MERTDLGVLDLVVPSSHAGKVSLLLTLSFCYVAYRVRVAPPSPPPAAPKQPWERSMGSATVLAVQGNIFGTISYVYGDAARGECVVVDSSGHAAYLSREAAKRGLRVTQLLQTHGHLDHVQALSDYLRAMRSLPPPRMHPGDRAMLRTYGIPIPSYGPLRVPCVARAAAAVVAWALGMSREPMPETANLDDGDVLAVGALRLEVLHVPGHTPGSCCFYDRVNKVLFSGDFLMKGTVGRVDLPQGDEADMARSLRRIAALIPDDVVVLSGHTDPTTMGSEKRLNPHLAPYARRRGGAGGASFSEAF